jgi:hypothetical protein
MAKPPRLEPPDQPTECNSGGAHFALIVRKALTLFASAEICSSPDRVIER